MKIFWIKAGGLVPLDVGGKIRSYNILKELARKHEITFFTFYAAHPNDGHADLRDLFYRSEHMALDIPRARSLRDYAGLLQSVISGLPYSVWKYCRPGVSQAIDQLARSEKYDVVICDFLLPAAVIPWDLPCPKIIFTHNVEAMIWKRHFEVAPPGPWKAISLREYRATDRFERKYLRRADHVLTVSAADRDVFSSFLPFGKIDVVPTGVDVDYYHPYAAPAKGNELVFTGAMDWSPNEEGIRHFADHILPIIQTEVADASLTVVGRNPTGPVKALAEKRGITVTGRVDDVRPYIARSAVYVVPLRVGSGTRLKIFEAMAMGKAVVSTKVGAEGLPVEHDRNILLADSPPEFAAAVIQLLQDHQLRRRIEFAAHELVNRSYSWKAIVADFESILAKVLGRQAAPLTPVIGV